MSADRIDPAVIEAAAKVIHNTRYGALWPWDGEMAGSQAERIYCRHMAEAAIRAADEKRGLKVETEWKVNWSNEIFAEQRIVSDWRPVEQNN